MEHDHLDKNITWNVVTWNMELQMEHRTWSVIRSIILAFASHQTRWGWRLFSSHAVLSECESIGLFFLKKINGRSPEWQTPVFLPEPSWPVITVTGTYQNVIKGTYFEMRAKSSVFAWYTKKTKSSKKDIENLVPHLRKILLYQLRTALIIIRIGHFPKFSLKRR